MTQADNTDPILIDMPMPIWTPRLCIRPVGNGDGEGLAAAITETWDQLRIWMPWAKDKEDNFDPISREVFCRQQYAQFLLRKSIMMVGEDRKTGTPLVYTGYESFDFRTRRFGIGYWVRKSAQRRGYATEVSNALTRYAFQALSANLVYLSYDDRNDKSRGVMEKLGFEFAYTRKFNSILPSSERILDNHVYERISTDGLPPLDVKW